MTRRTTLLPFALPDLGGDELNEIREVLDSGWITTGPKTRQFEQAFADLVGAKYAVAVSSCTAAMHLALEAIGVRPGDFVFTTPYTFAATAEVIRYFDAVPIFVDVQADTFNIDPAALTDTIADLNRCLHEGRKPRTLAVGRALERSARPRQGRRSRNVYRGAGKAIIPVHMAGHPCDMDAIVSAAGAHGLAVVEDAAHACSASFNGRPVGAPIGGGVPWAACFSFYATKTLATGEGGMITDRQRGAGGPVPHHEPARHQQGRLEAVHRRRQLVLRDHGARLQVQHAGSCWPRSAWRSSGSSTGCAGAAPRSRPATPPPSPASPGSRRPSSATAWGMPGTST